MARAALALLAAAPFAPALAGGTLYERDINMVWLPQVEVLVRALAAGDWPLWDPHTGFGQPLHADPRAGLLYPPTWLNLIAPPAVAYTLYVVGHVVASALGMLTLARHWQAGWLGAFAAGALWVLSGPLLSLAAMWHHLAGAAWMPWVTLAAARLIERPGTRRAALLAGVTALQILAGSPEMSLLAGGVALALLLRRVTSALGGGPGPAALGTLAAGALALGLSAAQWLPTMDVVSRSARLEQSPRDRAVWSRHPWTLPELVVPTAWHRLPLAPDPIRQVLDDRPPWLASAYLGAASAGLVAAGLLAGQAAGGALAALLAVAVVLALGSHLPGYAWLTAAVPPLGWLRYPTKAMVLAAFAWSLLAGRGVDAVAAPRLVAPRRWGARVMAPALAAVVVVLMAWAWLRWAAAGSGWLLPLEPAALAAAVGPASTSLLWGAAAAVTALALLARRAPAGRDGRPLAAALALVAIADLAIAHLTLHPVAPAELFAARPRALELAPPSPDARLYVRDYSIAASFEPRSLDVASPYALARAPAGWSRGAALVLGVHAYLNPPTAARFGHLGSFDLDILGLQPPAQRALVELLRRLEPDPDSHARLLRLGGVRHALALRPAAWWSPLEPAGTEAGFFEQPISVFRVPRPLGRAYVVRGARVAPDAQFPAMVRDPSFDPAREVVLAAGEARPAGPPPGRVRWLEAGGDRLELEAELETAGILVLADAYDPGWRASVAGAPAPLWRANLALRAVPLPAGYSRVVLEYRPPAVTWGAALSLVSLAVALALAARRPRVAGSGGEAGAPA